MIFGVGTDIVEYARFERMLERYGDRFAERVLSERELPEFRSHVHPARLLAKRFAAKEAFAKAVGSGLREPVSLHRISATHDDLGKPMLLFDETLLTHLRQLGVNRHHLSISDEHSMIVAFVVLETK
jgi:holo-[acyl-carrier protein] synthase